MHFCPKVPVMLVGCKKDLRRDHQTNETLRKQNQRPVAPEQVSLFGPPPIPLAPASTLTRVSHVILRPFISRILKRSFLASFRAKPSHRRLAPGCTSSARPAPVKVSAKSSNTPLVPLSSNRSTRGVFVSSYKIELVVTDGINRSRHVSLLSSDSFILRRMSVRDGSGLMKGINIGYCVGE